MNTSRALSALDKFGAVGAFLAAAAAPCCFPLLGTVSAALGLSALQSWRGYMDYAIQGFVALSVFGGFFAFRQHRQAWPVGRWTGERRSAFLRLLRQLSRRVHLRRFGWLGSGRRLERHCQ